MTTPEPEYAELLTPLPAQPDDGNAWVNGWCWLWCGWQYTRVLWIGAVGAPGATAPLFACGECIQLLHDSVWDYTETQHELPTDEWGRDLPLYRAPENRPTMVRFRRGRHRRPRTPLGERFFNAITAPADRADLDPPLPVGQPRESAPPRAAARREAGLHPPCQQFRSGESPAVETLASVR